MRWNTILIISIAILIIIFTGCATIPDTDSIIVEPVSEEISVVEDSPSAPEILQQEPEQEVVEQSTPEQDTPEEEPEEAKFYNQSTMCFYVGNYLTNNNSDVESLRNVLNIEFGFAVTDKILDYYLEDYYELCGLEEPIPNMVYEETKSYKVFYIVCILVLLMIAFVIFFIKRIERLEKIKGRNF